MAVYFLIQVGFYGLNTWIPTLIKTLTGQGFAAVGLIAALPYLVAIVTLVVNGIWADRTKRYAYHVFGATIVAAVGLMISVWVGPGRHRRLDRRGLPGDGRGAGLRQATLAAASRAIPAAVVGGSMGLVNALGNLGGFLGPYLGGYLQQRSGSFASTAIAYAIALVLAGVIMLLLPLRRPTATPERAVA